MRRSTPALIAALFLFVFVVGCGGSSSSGTSPTNTTTQAGANSAACAAYKHASEVGGLFTILRPRYTSATQVKQTLADLNQSLRALSEAASQGVGAAQSNLKGAVASFQSEVRSAQGKPVPEQIATIKAALGKLDKSLSQAASQLGC